MKRNVVLHPGYVASQTDGDVHYINGKQLMLLYGVRRRDNCVLEHHDYFDESDNVIHLYPLADGKYHNIHKGDDDES